MLYSSAHANEKKRLNELKPEARKVFVKFLREARRTFPKRTMVVAETYRTQKRQNELYRKGRVTTSVRVSQHTKRLAADIYFVRESKILKYEEAPYLKLGELGELFGLIWGGRWKVPFDPGHYELREVK